MVAEQRRPGFLDEAVRAARGFVVDERGVTVVEFALVAVPFLGLLMAIFQAGFTYFAAENLQVAVQTAARSLYVGTAQGNGVGTASAFVGRYMCPSGGGSLAPFIDCSKLIVDVRVSSAGTFSGLDTAADFYQAGATAKFCPGGPSDVVVVRVIYPLPLLIPVIGTTTGHDVGVVHAGFVNNVPNASGWRQLLLGTAVFRNEPFANGYTPPSGC